MDETDAVGAVESTAIEIRAVIKGFLQERLQPKLDEIRKKEEKLIENEEDKLRQLKMDRQRLLDSHEIETWIADAARRVDQIQQVTHAIKFTHPDARGTSLEAPGNQNVDRFTVGTHTIYENYRSDVVGNAAALDVYKFLRLEVGGKTLLKRAIESDLALRAAFSEDKNQAKSWMLAFANITSPKYRSASHKLAKQVYWPLGKGEYNLLAPLFPTSLVDVVWNTIQKDLYSETAKAAKEACRAGNSHPEGYREYPDMVIQKFGGTKPQNISQLNSERHGEAYLFSSCPPIWLSERVHPPLGVKSVFDGWFGHRKNVRELTRVLRDFLMSVQAVNNIRIREKRAELIGYLRDELFQFAAEVHELPGGWSRDQNCQLNNDEKCWLDPWRVKDDDIFASMHRLGNWRDAVCKRFGNWLNARLTSTTLAMGENEAREWQSVLDGDLRMIHMEIDIND